MADWTKPFDAAYRFVRVSRRSGVEGERIENMLDGTLEINMNTQTFESADVDVVGRLDVGTDLVRCYLDATFEDGTIEHVVLGTWLPSIPSRDLNDGVESATVYLDGRLAELQADSFESPVTIAAGANIIDAAARIVTDAGLDVDSVVSSVTLDTAWAFGLEDDGETDGGSKLDAVNSLMRRAGYPSASTDAMGRVALRPTRPIPTWTFREGEGATFLTDATEERDTRDVANVVLAIFETPERTTIGRAVDDSYASPYSTVNLGRRVVAKYSYNDGATQAEANAKARELLRTNQSVIRRVTLKHVHCPARVGDVVQVSWPSAGISGTYIIRKQRVEIGSAGCLTTSELRRFERAGT